jgi:anti-anti-sigma factor
MNISVSQAQGSVPVAVIKLDGKLDGQNYQELIAKAQELYNAGTRKFLLDLSGLTYISSAGLVALHSVALLSRGEQIPDTDQGWSTYRSLHSSQASLQRNLKLLNPRPEIINVLDMVGFGSIFETFTDLDQAVKSFS